MQLLNRNKLFNQTRWRLALWYAVVMGLILSLGGAAVYRTLTHARWIAIHRELESVVGTLHDSIEPTLIIPGRLEPVVEQLLPDICIAGVQCIKEQLNPKRHLLGAINQDRYYYMRLFDPSGRLVAIAGAHPEGLSLVLKKELWQTLKDSKGNRYHQISVSVHTQDYLPWGYLQVGRSIKDFDDDISELRWILLLGLPIVMLLVGVSSWWLAGLAMQPIKQSYQILQQFTADAAHELRTPTATLQATVEFLLKTGELPEDERQHSLSILERQSHRLSQLVKDLLLLNRMDRQGLPMQQQSCCLNDLISDLVEEFEDLAIAADVTLTNDIRVSKPLDVLGDSEQLYRLVSNLIVNAIHYTPAGGQVNVLLRVNDHQAFIEVQDTGIGIAPEDRTRIFDRFYRGRSDRSRDTGGSGLGLAIAAAIAQAHHGSLQLHSELGKGSTFTFQLPVSVTPKIRGV